MRGLIVSVCAGFLALVASSALAAIPTYRGTLSGAFDVDLLDGITVPVRSPFKVTLEADLSSLTNGLLAAEYLIFFESDTGEVYFDFDNAIEDSGFEIVLKPYHRNCFEGCRPRFFQRLLFAGALPEPTDYTLTVASVPEPATWAVMIGGFATTGMVLRRRRSLSMPA